ncbi:uncharacterized protein LOC128279002 [Anopheles cruzii]|uniref:uncharacterized protein LOC128279002 n=1 Tax=Anopheles cruzii TaxID=68878 RepID=UPI0022EC2B35|nr:uncharacterized protein LOC128279002 [Anopheles cruzii]
MIVLFFVVMANYVSLRSPGEPEQTVLEGQRSGIVSELTAVSAVVEAAASSKSTNDSDTFAGNLQATVQSKADPVQKRLSEEEELVEEEVEEEEEVVEEEEVEEESDGELAAAKPVVVASETHEPKPVTEKEEQPPASAIETKPAASEDTPATASPGEAKPGDVESTGATSDGGDTAASTTTTTDSKDHGEKPSVPPQTYLWEEVKKSKEQGGYPWTHLYKDECESGTEQGEQQQKADQTADEETVRMEKTVHQNGHHVDGTTGDDSVAIEVSNGHCAEQPTATGVGEAPSTESPRRSRKRAASHEPETSRRPEGRHSVKDEIKHFLDEHPALRNFSNSLTRKGKRTRTFVSRSLERAKSMADRSIDRARVQVTNTLRRKKAASEPPESSRQKILNLRESPRLNNREIPAYIVRQPSDEVVDREETIVKVTVEPDVVPSTVVVPDEIIPIPSPSAIKPMEVTEPEPEPVMVVEVAAPTTAVPPPVEDDRYEVIEAPTEAASRQVVPVPESPIVPVKAMAPQKAPRKKKDHHYEDIEDYKPSEVEEDTAPADAKLKRQEHIQEGVDPILGEMLGNEKIKISLQLQDEKFVDDMFGRRKHLDEILQQSSEEEREPVKAPIGSKGLLAPISSVDSTSSDEEARRTALSTLAEESDTGSVDGGPSPAKKQDSLKETLDLPTVAECSKELELTPAEEHLLAEREQPEQPQPESSAGAQTPVTTETDQSKVDTRWSKMSGESVNRSVADDRPLLDATKLLRITGHTTTTCSPLSASDSDSSATALNAQQRPSLLARYQPKGGSQDPLGTPAAPVGDNPVHPITKSTSQRSLQNSSLLQRYQPKPLGAAATTGRTPSQRSLDQSRLLRRYYQPHSLDDGQSPASPSTPADSTQLLQQPTQPQRYSSQKSLEGSKLLQRYSNTVNNSQEFTGLSGRESTPVAGFARAASLEPERSVQRSSLLSKYTPRFGKSLDRNQVPPPAAAAAAGYGSQQHLPQRTVPERAAQSLASSRAEIADYGADHFDQYRDSAVRSRSSSVSRGGPTPKKGGSLPRGSLRKLPAVDAEWATPVTPETLPMVGAVEEPVVGSIASAMPLPMVSVIPPTPAIGTEVGSAARMLPTTGLTPTVAPVAAPVAVPPIKPVRKDLPAQHIVSIAIPNITTALAAPSVKQSVSKPKEPSPPLFSTRDRLDHYGSASNPDPAPSSPAPTKTPTTTRLTKTTITTLQLPAINDLSSRRSITDLRGVTGNGSSPATFEVSEFTDRAELRQLANQRHHHAPVRHTLASAFEQLAVLSVPQAKLDDELEERIEAMPPDRKLKKRDFTYHPSFVPKQPASSSSAEKRAHDEDERHRREDEKRRREDERRVRDEEDRARKDAERQRKEDERRARDEEKRKEREEKKRLKDEKKKQKLAGKAGPAVPLPEAVELPGAPAEEMMGLASHLDHYSVATMQQTQQQQRSVSLGRPRASETPHGSHGALAPGRGLLSSSYQSLDRASATSGQRQSKLLQRYGPKAGSQEALGSAAVVPRELHRSQGSLDHRKPARASLLDKYTPRPLSASTAAPQPRSASQRSLERSSLLQRYKPAATPRHDPYEHRDHEYEPIGDPVDAAVPPAKPSRLLPDAESSATATGQERKLSNASFLRVPADDGDTISMEELQRSIEDRYFNLPSPPATGTATTGTASAGPTEEGAAAGEQSAEAEPRSPGKVKAAMAKAQSSGRQAMAKAQTSGRQAMAKAQEGGKNLQKKLLQQTDRFKTKMSHMKAKKPGEVEVQDVAAPLASPEAVTTPELEQLDFTLATPQDDEEEPKPEASDPTKPGHKFANRMKNMHMPKLQRPDFKRPEFTKKLPKLRGPDISMPKFKRPEMPKFLTERPDFGKMSDRMKLTRSRSMKETAPDSRASAASPSDVSTIGPQDDPVDLRTTKVNYTDFRTYPRLFDKLKKKAPAPSGQTSVRAGTPPPLEFTKASAKTTPQVTARWTSDKSSEDATGSNRFLAGSELDERETSVERRMRQELERAEFEGPELAVTAEQRQLEEYDKENRAIHQVSAARHDEFLRRKPPMERQESDLASEEEKQFWASSLGQKIRQNIDMNSNDLDFLDEEERLLVTRENREAEVDREAREQAQYLLELSRQREAAEAGRLDERRSSTPYTNQECQSSGSSGVRRRKGVLEEIDDDEFFLRQKGISKDNIQMGEYISSAIKEGLSQQPKNALADLDRYDRYYDDDEREGGLRRYYQPSFESDDVSSRQEDLPSSYGRTFPPDRPNRRAKKGGQMYGDEYGDEEGDEDLSFYDRPRRSNRYGSEQPELLRTARYMDEDLEFEDDQLAAGSVVPPTPPTRRRKKRFRDVTPSDVDLEVVQATSNHFITAGSLPTRVATYRAAEEVPLAREESFGTIPTSATPSRERLRSQLDAKGLRDDNDDGADRVSRGAESLIGGIIDAAPGARGAYPYEVSENNGYAIVRKEAPPRPPAPMRRRKSTRSLDAPPSAPVRQFHTLPSYSVSPVRPQRNYSTISPNRPPRRKSVSSLTGSQQQLGKSTLGEVAPYEDVLDAGPTQAPAPPRPPPPATKLKSGDVVNRMKDRPLPAPPRPTRKTRRPDGTFDHHQDLDGGAERMVSAGEVETATQTDPLSDDFGLDAEIAAVTAAASRATDTEVLEGALSRFRDGNARALSDRPKSSRSGSRPETPASILIERKVSTPSLTHESVVEASLTVQPLDGEFDDDQYIAELVKKYVSDEARKPEPRKTERSDRFRKSTSSLGRSEDPIDPVAVGGSSALRPASLRSTSRSSVDGRLLAITPEPLRNVEISPTVIEEIVERLRTTEQLHIDELHRLHQQQLEDLRRQHEDQKRQQEQRLEQQQRQLLDQQSQQLNETQKLKEQIVQQQNQQQLLLTQQQNQQQLLLVAQQQQQLLMEQQDKERELQREKERELLRERELELERARERERELHLAREAELQRAREVEQQRLRDLELQRAIEAEKVRQDRGLRELELQRAIEAEQARHREAAQAQAAHEAAVAREQAGAAAHESQVAKETAPTASEPPTEGATVDVVDGATVPVVTPQEQPPVPVRPPLPLPPFAYHPDYLAYGVSPSAAAAAAAAASSYLMRANAPPSEEDGMAPLAPQRRRRHHRSRRESTSEEDQQLHRERERRQHRHATRSPEPSIQSLGGQLMRACGTSLRQTGDDLMSMLRASSKDENKRDLHIAIIVLIVIVAGLMALGMSGEKAVHHHHWDYFSPPGHGSSA